MFRILPTLIAMVVGSCSSYQIDGAKPSVLRDVNTIALPMFTNGSLHPRAEALATSAAADAMVRDGTYRVASSSDADAILEVTVKSIQYAQLRATRLDTRRPEELQNTVTLEWVLRDSTNHSTVLARGTSVGSSRFFVNSNLQSSRNNALPDAIQRACNAMVSRISNGY